MSEEIATARADLAHIARLQEQLNHWRERAQQAEDALLTTLERQAHAPPYDAWRDVRRRCLEELADMKPSDLRLLMSELRGLADVIAGEVARRDRAAERADARLYRPKGP